MFIEFIGLPGSGKTTLLTQLVKTRESGDDWISGDESIIKLGKILTNDSGKLKQALLKPLFWNSKTKLPVSRYLIKIKKGIIENTGSDHYDWSPLAQFCYQSNIHQRLKECCPFTAIKYLNWMREAVLHTELLAGKIPSDTVLFDQHLFQIVRLFLDPDDTPDELTLVLKKIPIPAGIIYVETDPKTIIERRKKRGSVKDRDWISKNNQSEMEKLYRDVKIYQILLEAFEKANIPVYKFRDNDEDHINKVSRFINEIVNRKRTVKVNP